MARGLFSTVPSEVLRVFWRDRMERPHHAVRVGGIEALPDGLRKLAERQIRGDERPLFTLVGERKQALVALDRRLLVLKAGLQAGLPFHGSTTCFDYRDIERVEVERGPVLSVIWVSSTAFTPGEKEWWHARDPYRDPFRAPNACPVSTARLELYGPFLEMLRQAIADAGGNGKEGSLVSSLERLAALHESGALTSEEFEAAKARLLGPG